MDLSVNYGTLAAAAADIQASAGQIESRLNELDRSLQPLRANWTGEAATAYEAAKAKWTSALTDMKMLLAQIGNQVTTTSQNYQATDRNVAQRF
ncbi:WXG100 family type VII secretion target [Actinotalea fermentans]|uniref:ESAT-6-like protein n=1 Tax=Actinotalea fermentans TaxID=43671 RepID=A0A511Z0C4_9CELL|nr:WXG100 family type VII secretion target [Actinotalea fermentans]KGM15830.1 hypothetical protein N867_05120 [Actinotalea fermentans ATCC 43279 = JCM 9966 = DSM 3133]GEN80895.1 hypothetical protein AFE02nite_26290 [Actinotalea fermentans]